MARTDNAESTTDLTGTGNSAPHHQGLHSAQARTASGPLLGDGTERGAVHAGRGRTAFASFGGWAISR